MSDANTVSAAIVTAVGLVVSNGLTAILTNWNSRRKSRNDENAAMFSGINAATKQLVDGLFSEVHDLRSRVDGYSKDLETTRQELADTREELTQARSRAQHLENEIDRLKLQYGERP